MFTVYALYSPSSDKLYIGYTSDIQQRLLSHNQLAKKGFTVKYRPWELFYTEEFESKQDAMKREKELKSYRGRVFLRSQLNTKNGSCTENQSIVYPWFKSGDIKEIVVKATDPDKIKLLKDNLKLAPDAKIDFSKSNLKLYCSSADQQVIGQVISLK